MTEKTQNPATTTASAAQNPAAAFNAAVSDPATHDAGAKLVNNVAEGTAKAAGAAKDLAVKGTAAVTGAPSAEPEAAAADKDKDNAKKNPLEGFMSEGGIGKVLGGLLGLGGAWFLGNFFGGGIFSTILTIALAVPLAIIGSDKIGDMINGWMGHPKKVDTAHQQAVDQAAMQAKSQGIAPSTQPTVDAKPALALTEQELQALLSAPTSDHQRVKVYTAPNDPALHIRPVAANEATVAGVYNVDDLYARAQASTRGQVAGIAFVPDGAAGFNITALTPRVATSNQR